MVYTRTLILYVIVLCDSTFLRYINYFDPNTLTLLFGLLMIKNFNLGNAFWKICSGTLIFYIIVPCNKAFLWVPADFTMWWFWTWPLSLFHLLKTLILALSFEQYLPGLGYFTSHECSLTNKVDLVTLTLMFDLLFENSNLGYIFRMACTRTSLLEISHQWSCDKTFPWLIIIFSRYYLCYDKCYKSFSVVTVEFRLLFKSFNVDVTVNKICHS
jgi:hypothetical protein